MNNNSNAETSIGRSPEKLKTFVVFDDKDIVRVMAENVDFALEKFFNTYRNKPRICVRVVEGNYLGEFELRPATKFDVVKLGGL